MNTSDLTNKLNKIILSEDLLDLFKLYKDNGYNLYMVGGVVRDYILGNEVSDIDFAADATPMEQLELLKDYNISTHRIDLGLVIVKINNISYEITSFRQDIGIKDVRYPEQIKFVKDINVDAVRRDFTINALYYNPYVGLVDPINGYKEIENKTIRLIGNQIDRFIEDPLRILRALRFSLQLGFEIDSETMDAILELKSRVSLLDDIKYSELFKILSYDNFYKFDDILRSMFENIDFDYIYNTNVTMPYLSYIILIYLNKFDYVFDNHLDNLRFKCFKRLLIEPSEKTYKEVLATLKDETKEILFALKGINPSCYNIYIPFKK